MRHTAAGGRFSAGSPLPHGFADFRYHHGFHGAPILFLAIGLAVIFLAWVFWKKLEKRKLMGTGFELPLLRADEPLTAYDAPSSQRAAILDQWEQTILKEDN